MLRKLTHGIVIGLLSSAFAVALWFGGWLNWLESASWDFRVKSMAEPGAATEKIMMIVLDQTSLDWGKEQFSWGWPWDRTIYTPIIDFCKRGGAKAVMFDVFFTEPSKAGVADDETLGSCMATNKNVVAALLLNREQGQTSKWPAEIPAGKFNITGLDAFFSTKEGESLILQKASFSIP